jgi:phosphatidate phosphatase PAH1
LLKTNAAIWYNKTCRSKHLEPKYIEIKIKGKNEQSANTKQAAVKYRLNQEIKFLYKKKETLNKMMYRTHLEGANNWSKLWHCIQTSVNQTIDDIMDKQYQKLNKKLDMTQKQNTPQKHNKTHSMYQHTFYTRIQNLTHLKFTKEQINMLKLGFSYAIDRNC